MIADEIRAVTKNYKSIRFNGELLALADRVEAVERDAARYRWLRTRINWRDKENRHLNSRTRFRSWEHCDYRVCPPESEHIDDYIDAAIKEQADATKR